LGVLGLTYFQLELFRRNFEVGSLYPMALSILILLALMVLTRLFREHTYGALILCGIILLAWTAKLGLESLLTAGGELLRSFRHYPLWAFGLLLIATVILAGFALRMSTELHEYRLGKHVRRMREDPEYKKLHEEKWQIERRLREIGEMIDNWHEVEEYQST